MIVGFAFARGDWQLLFNYFQATEDHLRLHYADLSSKPFFPGLVKYMASGPVVAMVSILTCNYVCFISQRDSFILFIRLYFSFLLPGQ